MFRDSHGLLALLLPAVAVTVLGASASAVVAQDRQIVFNQVTVSGTEAAIVVEFADGEELSVSFRDQRVLVDGTEVGRYASGGPLEGAWRSFLGRAVAADNEELASLLRDWSAPPGLEGDAAQTAGALEARLQSALAAASPPAAPPRVIHPEGDLQELVERLILRGDRLRALAAAAGDLRSNGLRVHVGEDVHVEEDEVVPGSLLVLDGNLTIDGEVQGDVILLGGRVSLGDQARIAGDLRWTDAAVSGNRAAVAGAIREVQPVADRPAAALRDEIREEVRQAMEASITPERRRVQRTPFFVNIARGVGSVFQTLVTFAILFGLGLLVLYFAPRNFEVTARTARYAMGRAALVGLAGSLLAFPLWIVGIVVLAVTVIGIPVMLLWLPLFPAALALAVIFGYLAVARNLGRWASERHIHLESLDPGRPAVQLGAGLVLLLAAFALAGVFQMGGPWLSLFRGLLTFLGVFLTVFAGLVGLGAVLLSRGGRDPLYAGSGWTWAGETDPWASEGDPFRASSSPGRSSSYGGASASSAGSAPFTETEPAEEPPTTGGAAPQGPPAPGRTTPSEEPPGAADEPEAEPGSEPADDDRPPADGPRTGGDA